MGQKTRITQQALEVLHGVIAVPSGRITQHKIEVLYTLVPLAIDYRLPTEYKGTISESNNVPTSFGIPTSSVSQVPVEFGLDSNLIEVVPQVPIDFISQIVSLSSTPNEFKTSIPNYFKTATENIGTSKTEFISPNEILSSTSQSVNFPIDETLQSSQVNTLPEQHL